MEKKQLMSLRQQAHKLNPVVIIGAQGLSDAVLNEIDVALKAHELIKIRLNAEDRTELKLMIEMICLKQNATLVQSIGHTAVIYRQREETA